MDNYLPIENIANRYGSGGRYNAYQNPVSNYLNTLDYTGGQINNQELIKAMQLRDFRRQNQEPLMPNVNNDNATLNAILQGIFGVINGQTFRNPNGEWQPSMRDGGYRGSNW